MKGKEMRELRMTNVVKAQQGALQEKGEELHKTIPGSQLKTIPRCAHLAQEDAPDAVVGYLTDL
jgi:pimeloyl-ACP methyl ester carboxylesterase